MVAYLTNYAIVSNMSSEVIYARVPKSLKDAADAYAQQRGGSLTKAVADLLDRGLTAVSDAQSLANLESEFGKVVNERDQLVAQLHAAKTDMVALNAFANRANVEVGTCPNSSCGRQISGYDLLGSGQCGVCGQALTSLVAPSSSSSTLDQREVMVLLGALGAVLGMAYLASK